MRRFRTRARRLGWAAAVVATAVACGPALPSTGSDDEESGDSTRGATHTSAATGSESVGSTTGSDASSTRGTGEPGSTGAGETGTTQPEPTLTPAEQAAALACAALEETPATEIPAPMMAIGFAFSEFPARFRLDFSQADPANVFEGDLWCHSFSSGCLDCACPLNDCWRWPDDDGEFRLHMVTRGIDHVEFYGTGESPADVPGAPLTPSVHDDVPEQCPDLPRVWTPDPVEGMYSSSRIVCMHHAEDLAEVVFVRIP